MQTSKPKTGHPYGYAYQKAVIEAGELLQLKFGPHLVLTKLVGFCNKDTGQCYPNKETLAGSGRQGVRTVQRHLRTLESTGLIVPFAYRTGGKGRATVYTFGLPQWSRPAFKLNDAKLAWLAQSKGANLSLKGAILSLYHANLAPQPREQDLRKGDEAPASRGEDGPRLHGVTFTELLAQTGTYLEARRTWDGWKEEEALRAAENEDGEKIYVGT